MGIKKYFKEIIFLLNGKNKDLLWLVAFFFLGSFLDVIGIGLIAPYVALSMNAEFVNNETLIFFIALLDLPTEYKPLLELIGFSLIVVFLIKAMFLIYINYRIFSFGQEHQAYLRSYLMESYQRLVYTEFLKQNSASYIYNIQALTSGFVNGVLISGLKALSDAIVGISILILLFAINAKIMLALLMLVVSVTFFYDFFLGKKVKVYGENANKASTKFIKGINESISGLKEIRILGKESFFLDVVTSGVNEYKTNFLKSQVISLIPKYFMEFSLMAFMVLIILVNSNSDSSAESTIPFLATLGVALMRMLPIFNSILNNIMQLRFNRNTVSRLYYDLASLKSKEVNSNHEPIDHIEKCGKFRNITFKNITFKYERSSKLVLNDISFTINRGDSIGFIGPSGSGKTTLVDIMLGLLEPNKGDILYNEHLIGENKGCWRSQVAYLPQQSFLTDGTIRCNVALGVAPSCINDELVTKALKRAQLDDFVNSLPDGVNTTIGESGKRLSGGQRQRISLARAFYHERDVLIMDESTSSIDIETENEIVNETEKLKGDKTLIIIAHRLETLKYCDRIYHLADGRLSEFNYAND